MSMRALIIFAKFPREGEVKTRLGLTVGMKEAAKIYEQFAEHAFTLGHQILEKGDRVYVFHGPGASAAEMRGWIGPQFNIVSQEGETLGDRMRHAFAHTFAEGARHTVIIGTDVPELDLHTLERAFGALTKNDVVIGPSSDGGYYLLGMNAPTKELFAGIVWSSGTVYHNTLQHLHHLNLSSMQLDTLADIDTMADYSAYQDRMRRVKHPLDP